MEESYPLNIFLDLHCNTHVERTTSCMSTNIRILLTLLHGDIILGSSYPEHYSRETLFKEGFDPRRYLSKETKKSTVTEAQEASLVICLLQQSLILFSISINDMSRYFFYSWPLGNILNSFGGGRLIQLKMELKFKLSLAITLRWSSWHC